MVVRRITTWPFSAREHNEQVVRRTTYSFGIRVRKRTGSDRCPRQACACRTLASLIDSAGMNAPFV
jgi:hypothetical protein